MRRILVLVVAVLALAACSKADPEVTANDQVPAEQRTEAAAEGASEGGEAAGGGSEPLWVAKDIEFVSAPVELPAGETEITLENTGAAPHNVTIDGETIVEAGAGATEVGTIDLKPGTYEYICSVPGHEGSMNGELTVK